ncbi:g7177 [Coccomyxa elongata]
MSSRELDEADQIVASGEALNVVSKWLGLSSFQDALAADPYQNSSIPDEPRPPLLGLGADPRKYHKTLSAASKLERRLGQRLKGREDNQQSPADAHRNGRRESAAHDSAILIFYSCDRLETELPVCSRAKRWDHALSGVRIIKCQRSDHASDVHSPAHK